MTRINGIDTSKCNMYSAKKILIIIFILFIPLFSAAQNKGIDSIKTIIDSLKTALPELTDSSKLKCLKELINQYLKVNQDSTIYYTKLIYAEAKYRNDFDLMGKSKLVLAMLYGEDF